MPDGLELTDAPGRRPGQHAAGLVAARAVNLDLLAPRFVAVAFGAHGAGIVDVLCDVLRHVAGRVALGRVDGNGLESVDAGARLVRAVCQPVTAHDRLQRFGLLLIDKKQHVPVGAPVVMRLRDAEAEEPHALPRQRGRACGLSLIHI